MLKLRQPSVHYTGARQCLWVTACVHVGVWERWVTQRDDSNTAYIPYKFNSGWSLSVPVRKFVLRAIRSFHLSWAIFYTFFSWVERWIYESMSWDFSNITPIEEIFFKLQRPLKKRWSKEEHNICLNYSQWIRTTGKCCIPIILVGTVVIFVFCSSFYLSSCSAV